MFEFHRGRVAGLATVAALLASQAHATILTFDTDNTQPTTVLSMDQAYGDRVTSTVQGGATYGVGAEGFTPNVTAAYGPGGMTRWTTDYGDLVNILENESDGDTLLQVKLTADPGYGITLYGFDLGGWPNTDYTIAGFSVLSGGSVLYSATNVFVAGATGSPRHSTFDFGSGLLGTGGDLTLNIDLTGLGGSSDNIGIDNVRFGQSGLVTPPGGVPEPATWAMMIMGFAAIGATLRRRRELTAAI